MLGSAAAAFLDFLVHGARDKVTRCQVFQRRGITLHETLAFAVAQNCAFTAAAFCQQHARASHAGRVKLPELHVFQGNAGTCRHAQAVTGVDEGVGRCCKDAACTAGRQHGGLGFEDVYVAGFHFNRGHANDVASFIANQIKCHPFDEEAGFFFHVLLVQRVQHGVAGTVGRCAGALDRLFTVVGGVAAEGALVNRAVRVTVKRHAHVLKVIHNLGCFTAHELDGILVAEPVGTLDGVIEVVVPVVFAHVAERGTDATLCCDSVRTGREHLGQHGDIQAGTRQLEGCAHAGAAGTDDDDVKFALWEFGSCGHDFYVGYLLSCWRWRIRRATEPGWPSRRNPPATQS